MGCVQVFLNEDTSKNDPNRIFFTSWCSICNEVTPSVPISETTKCLSFAKYLELRFHGHAYKKRLLEDVSTRESTTPQKCEHSLHRDYIHYFTYRGVGAKFMYTPVEVWEIGLPSLILYLKLPKPLHQFDVLEDVKDFSMKGHEVYSKIYERIADTATEDETLPILISLKTMLSKDQFLFKQHIEIVQTLLTDKSALSYDLNDALFMAKRVLAESIEFWDPRLHELSAIQKGINKQDSSLQQQQHHNIDSGTICTEDLRTDGIEALHSSETKPPIHVPQSEDIPELEQTQANVSIEKLPNLVVSSSASTDKKSIKKMLSNLLPSTAHISLLQSPINPQEHFTLPLGIFPVLVRDNDLSSIIAYCLSSTDYRKTIDNLGVINVNIQLQNDAPANSPNTKRKSQEG